MNRHVVALDYLPAGTYVLTLREAHDGDASRFCSKFTFALDIQPITLNLGASFTFGPSVRAALAAGCVSAHSAVRVAVSRWRTTRLRCFRPSSAWFLRSRGYLTRWTRWPTW
jgi:hypothetical protein